jgi:hypothetical protein
LYGKFFGLLLSPAIAAAMSFGSVVANAPQLRASGRMKEAHAPEARPELSSIFITRTNARRVGPERAGAG